MQDLSATLAGLRRPKLLVHAARIGAQRYRRDAHLRRHLGQERLPGSAAALTRLIALEAELEASRREATIEYSPARHVGVLIAMMGEARLIEADPTCQPGPRRIS